MRLEEPTGFRVASRDFTRFRPAGTQLLTVQRLRPGDEEHLASARLCALAESPSAFASSYEREAEWGVDHWRSWLAKGSTLLARDENDNIVGVAAAFPQVSDRLSISIESVWVHPRHRGTGAASQLIECLLASTTFMNAAIARLFVAADNRRAIAFYTQHGFRPTGTVWLRPRDQCLELEMELQLDHASHNNQCGQGRIK